MRYILILVAIVTFQAVAKNPLVTKEMLTRLSFDENDFVRRTVAENKKTPLDILKKFVIDPSRYVRSNVVSNKAVPKVWLRENFPEQFRSDHIKARFGSRGGTTLGSREGDELAYLCEGPQSPEYVAM
ncbi:hypothetical protein N9J88_05755 [Porticoccaceae bacterium]|nr:hypothetical protein [Porticoccaceae bacterium]